MEYAPLSQAAYLAELTVFVAGLFAAGFLLLRSKREKDKQYQWWGWVFYGLAFVCIGIMWVLALGFQGG